MLTPSARARFLVGVLCCAASPLLAQGIIDDVDTKLPRAKAPNPDAVAVVIGNRSYQQKDVPRVEYAVRDAEAMRSYLVNTLGYRQENIIFVADAGKAQFEAIFGNATDAQGRRSDYIKPGRSDVFIFYSGHGAPDPTTEKSYFVPADGDPNYIRLGGYPVELLYSNLKKLKYKSLTVVLDACFSGFTENGTLVREASPALLKVKSADFDLPNAALFAASAQNQISSWYSDRQHGLFTYYFLKGLQGAAASGKESLSAGDLQAYLESEVPSMARRIKGREQVPQFMGDKGRVIAAYGKGTLSVAPPAKVDLANAELQGGSARPQPSNAAPSAAPSSAPAGPSGLGAASRLPLPDVKMKRELGAYSFELRGCAVSPVGVLCHFDVTSANAPAVQEISIQGVDENSIPGGIDCASIGTGPGCEQPSARRDMVFRPGYSRFLVRFPSISPSATQLKIELRLKVNGGWRGSQELSGFFDPVEIVR